MTPLLILAAIAGAPVLIGLLLRVNAIYLYLSAAAGSMLVQYLSDDASLAVRMVIRDENVPMATQFGLLGLPIILTLLFLRKSMPRSKVLLHVLPLIATGLAIGALALPLFDSNAQHQVFESTYGTVIKDAQDVAVGAATVLTLILMWITARHKEENKKHKKH